MLKESKGLSNIRHVADGSTACHVAGSAAGGLWLPVACGPGRFCRRGQWS